MNRIYERVLHKSGSSNKKRRQKNDSSEENCLPKKRRKGKPKPTVQPVGEMARREEERLEKLVLGDVTDLLHHDDSEVPSFSCTSAMEDSGVEEGDSDSSPQMSDTLASPEREPAWQDEEDLNICVSEAMSAQGRKVPEILSGGSGSDPYTRILKHKYEARMGTPSWANLGHRSAKKSGSSDDDSDDELLQHCGNFLSNRSSVLRKGSIEVKRVCDLNRDTYTEGPVIKAVEFHPSSSVALVAGLSGIASLFDVNGKKNTKLHSVQFERYPILCAHFVPSGEQFVIGSRHHGFFYNYDMMVCRSIRAVPNSGLGITNTKNFKLSPDGRLIAVCGRFGNIHLLTANTLEGVGLLKMNSDVSAIAFDSDGSRLFSHGEGGEVHVWDIGTRRCLGRFTDDGCIWGSSLAVAPGGRFLACGARSGVVNVYETAGLLSAANRAPRPTKILLNLTTSATTVKFNASSELLGMASDDKDNAFRLVHFPSMTVFSNFPGSSQPHLARPQCLDFSPNSGYLAIGNNKGAALLYRLKHYGNY
ncbi:U3 small nucleolar RNA-associated protein 18 homolog [Periplaneta americana]|uniref:U3 small nucleolar RNA-associated protein 18 homolog n=1 Tax=Periplaneta americana TaxID=6978 RepID=UPI0037E94A37